MFLNNIFEYIYNTIKITKLIILPLLNLLLIAILASLLTYFFFVIKNYFLQLDLKLFKIIFDNNTFEACCNIKNVDKIVKKD